MKAFIVSQDKPDVTKRFLHIKNMKWSYFLFLLPALLFYLVFFFYPVLLGFFYSFTNWDGIAKSYKVIGLKNYASILQDMRFLQAIKFTFTYALMYVILKLTLALIIALLLNGNMKLRGFFRSVYFFPAVLSLITVSLVFNQLFYAVIPRIGEGLGLEWLSQNLLSQKETAVFGIIIANLWHGFSVPMVIFLAGLASVPKDLHEAATIDGASPFQRFISITVPFLIPMLNVNLVISIKGALTVFESIMAMTGGGPASATESVGYLIYQHGINDFKFAYATAESICIFVIVAVISVIQIKVLNRKEAGQQ
ncbi:sugar ABC transporter permease [Paenibacillus doosanensis]|uniref:carbohydrate ABC transporter permease n=1 Tax=Paenibacillus doosanensis TaxID=1229154 RepID=UPI00217F49F9|nr:sugar ABC transporter permease [Paenibacillus doosanensis]MCS7461443.1 sugar ABC transporter permease [Paenibacillus doosanensis]